MELIVVSTLYQVTNIGGPVFTKSLQKLIIVVQTNTNYDLPSITDPDNDNYTISTNLETASIFAVFKYPIMQLKPKTNNAGNYSISIKLTDSNVNPKTTSYTLTVVVLTVSQAQAYFNKTNESQIVTQGYSKTLNASITQIDQNGLLTVKFSSMIYVPKNYSSFNASVIQIIIIPSSASANEDLSFTWQIINMTQTQMLIQLNFSNPADVSAQVSFTFNFCREMIS